MTKNIELRDSIVSALNKVDESAFGAEVAVMESVYQAYDRALTVIANYDGDITQDFGLFQESFIMEDGEEKDQVLKQDGQEYHTKEGFRRAEKGDDGKLKVESMFKTIIAFIPRLIGFIYKKIVGFFKGESKEETKNAVSGIKNVIGILTDSDKDLLDRISELFQSNDFIKGLLGAGGIGVGVTAVAGLVNFFTFKTKEAEMRQALVSSFNGLFGAKAPDGWFNTKKIPSPAKVYNKIKIVTKEAGIKNMLLDLAVVKTFFDEMTTLTENLGNLFDNEGNIKPSQIDKNVFSREGKEEFKIIRENPKEIIKFDDFTSQLDAFGSSTLADTMGKVLDKFKKASKDAKASDASEDLKKQAADIKVLMGTYNDLTNVVVKLVEVIKHLNDYVKAHSTSLNEIKKKIEEMGGEDKNKISKLLSAGLGWLWSKWIAMKGQIKDSENVDEDEATVPESTNSEDTEPETSTGSTEEAKIVPDDASEGTESSEESQTEITNPVQKDSPTEINADSTLISDTNTTDGDMLDTDGLIRILNTRAKSRGSKLSDEDINNIKSLKRGSQYRTSIGITVKAPIKGDYIIMDSYVEKDKSSYWDSFI